MFYVVRIGDGTATTLAGGTSHPVFLEKRQIDIGLASSTLIGTPLALSTPTDANLPFSLSASATSEGALARSVNGAYVALAGYAAAPGTANVAGTTATAVPRVVARVSAAGQVDITTHLTSAFSGSNPRSVASVDGTSFWVSGSGTSGGIYYIPFGGAGGTQVLSTPTTLRVCGIFGGQLFGTAATTVATVPYHSVFSVSNAGSALPTTAGGTATVLAGLPTADASPYGFALLDRDPTVSGLDTLYIADDGNVNTPEVPTPGVQKWKYNGGTSQWERVAIFTDGLGTMGARSLLAIDSGITVTLVVTTGEAAPNHVVVYVDDGSQNPIGHVIATASPMTVYRGVALAP